VSEKQIDAAIEILLKNANKAVSSETDRVLIAAALSLLQFSLVDLNRIANSLEKLASCVAPYNSGKDGTTRGQFNNRT
jgi:hypothetical protein